MYNISVKLAEVGFRALFIVFVTYSLDLREAGMFGLAVTLQGLASFAFGFERYIDVQRRMIGETPARIDLEVRRVFKFFCVNYLAMMPIFLAGMLLTTSMPWQIIASLAVIAIGEHVMNQVYFVSIIDRRYSQMLLVSAVKNAVLLLVFLYLIGISSAHKAAVETVLLIWAVTVLAAMAIMFAIWMYIRKPVPEVTLSAVLNLTQQYKASHTHFFLGLLAVLALQFDRLSVGYILPFEEVGVYFRHVMVVGLIYQVFGIFSANQIARSVYAAAKVSSIEDVYREAKRFFPIILAIVFVLFLLFLIVWSVYRSPLDRYHLDPVYFLGLLVAAAARMRADINAIVFNAYHEERTVLRLQLIAFGFSAVMLIVLTSSFWNLGAVIAVAGGSSFYLLISSLAIRRLRESKIDVPPM